MTVAKGNIDVAATPEPIIFRCFCHFSEKISTRFMLPWKIMNSIRASPDMLIMTLRHIEEL